MAKRTARMRPAPGPAGAPWLMAVLLLLTAASCASYSTRLRDLRAAAAGGQTEAALAQIAKASQPGDLLYHLERGSLLHHGGRFAESNAELALAEELLEDLYTISISRRVLTLAINDEVEAYRGEIHEADYLHYYRVLNYLAMDRPWDAAVEARRLALRLAGTREQLADEPLLKDDPLLEFLIGAVLESAGEWNDALIAYRLAALAQDAWEAEAGWRPGSRLTDDMLRSAAAAGIAPEEIPELAALTPAERAAGRQAQEPNAGRLIVLVEWGWAPMKESVHLRLPIFEDDPDWEGEAGAREAGWVLADRYRNHRRHGVWSPGKHTVAYFLDVAVPVLREAGATPGFCQVRLEPGRDATTVAATDLGAMVRREFARRELAVLAKTFARAVIKYAAQRKAEKELGSLAGLLANLAGVATEKADSRSWLLLPAEIQVADIWLPPGEHHLELVARDADGRGLGRRAEVVEITPRGLTVLTWRLFD